MSLKFDDLVSMIRESKGTKPGERFKSVQDKEGPSGISSSPIGKSDYNPEKFTDFKNDPKDKGSADFTSTIKLLGKAFQLLKNDDVFIDQMKGIMNGFKRNRNQISAYQESVLKTKPKTIDNLWGQINRLITIVNDPKKREDKDHGKFVDELEKLRATKDAHEEELNKVYSEVENVAGDNEEINNEYLEQLLTVIKHTTQRLYKKQLADLENSAPLPPTIIPMHELDFSKLADTVSKDAEAQLKLLEMLMSSESSVNPLIAFMDLQEERYDEAKNLYFQAKRGDNYSISIEQLYRNLPLFSLVNYFSHVILKSPAITLNKKQSKRVSSGGDDMLKKLSDVKNEAQFDNMRPEILEYIKGLKLPKESKNGLKQLANGPFVVRKGAPNAAFKLRSMLVASSITESFDEYSEKILKSVDFDEDSFKLDLMEVTQRKKR